jgi:hypothetical protein
VLFFVPLEGVTEVDFLLIEAIFGNLDDFDASMISFEFILLVDHSIWEPVAVIKFIVNLIIIKVFGLNEFPAEETASLHAPLVYIALLIKGKEFIFCFTRAQVEISLSHAQKLLGVSVKERNLYNCEVSQQKINTCVVFIIVKASDLPVTKIEAGMHELIVGIFLLGADLSQALNLTGVNERGLYHFGLCAGKLSLRHMLLILLSLSN